MPPSRDPYELLGLDRTADLRQVKRAYRRLAKLYHPDTARDDGRSFVALRAAYETLSDPARRIDWDRRHPGSGRGPATAASRRAPGGPSGAAGAPAPGMDTAAQELRRYWRSRDRRGRFARADTAIPWWEEIRGGRSVGADVPGTRGETHLGPSSSGAAWSAAARAYLRRLTRPDRTPGPQARSDVEALKNRR